jgi:hypothetical protein
VSIVVRYNSSVAGQSVASKAYRAVNAAVQFYDQEFTNNITVNVTSAWASLGANAIADSNPLWQDGAGSVAVWEMSGANPSGFDANAGRMSSGCRIAGVGHFSGAADGPSDVAWVGNSNHVQLREMATVASRRSSCLMARTEPRGISWLSAISPSTPTILSGSITVAPWISGRSERITTSS